MPMPLSVCADPAPSLVDGEEAEDELVAVAPPEAKDDAMLDAAAAVVDRAVETALDVVDMVSTVQFS